MLGAVFGADQAFFFSIVPYCEHKRPPASEAATTPKQSPAQTSDLGTKLLQEPAKSSSSVASTGCTTGIQCHRCHGFGHMRKDCPSQQAYIAIEDGYISASDIEDDEEEEEEEEEEEVEEAVEGGHVLGSENTAAFRSIIVKRVLSVQAQQPEKLQCHNLFQIFFVINNQRACVIIDGGSCNNLVSLDLVKKLGLATRPHPHPYYIQWFNDAGKAKVTQSCRVSFSIVAMLIM